MFESGAMWNKVLVSLCNPILHYIIDYSQQINYESVNLLEQPVTSACLLDIADKASLQTLPIVTIRMNRLSLYLHILSVG